MVDEREGIALVRAARDGDGDARGRLFRLYAEPLRAWLRKNVGPQLERAVSLSDLAQDTFLGALEALRVLPDSAGLGDFEGILFQHARWQLLGHVERHRDFRGESMSPTPAGEATPDPEHDRSQGEVTRRDQELWVRELVERLPPEQAAVVRLRLDGRTFREIGDELDLTEDAAQKRFLRGSLALHELVGRR